MGITGEDDGDIQRQIAEIQASLRDLRSHMDQLRVIAATIEPLDRLTDAKFVTFRTLIDSNSEKVALALSASDKAITKAEIANEKRFDAVNEFRSQLSDQAATFARREYVEQEMAAVDRRLEDASAARVAIISEFRSTIDKLVTKDTLEAFVSSSSADRAGLHDRVKALESRMDISAGQQQGGKEQIGESRLNNSQVLGIIGVLVAIMSVVVGIIISTR